MGRFRIEDPGPTWLVGVPVLAVVVWAVLHFGLSHTAAHRSYVHTPVESSGRTQHQLDVTEVRQARAAEEGLIDAAQKAAPGSEDARAFENRILEAHNRRLQAEQRLDAAR